MTLPSVIDRMYRNKKRAKERDLLNSSNLEKPFHRKLDDIPSTEVDSKYLARQIKYACDMNYYQDNWGRFYKFEEARYREQIIRLIHEVTSKKTDMELEFDVTIRLSPKNEYTKRARINSVNKATPRIVEP